MKYILISFLLIFTSACSTSKKRTLTPKEYLNEVFVIIEKKSINRDSIDLQSIKKVAYAKLKDTDSIENCYPIIQSILKNLRDNHSRFLTREQVNKWESTSLVGDNQNLITFSGKLLNENIGYIHMKGFSSGDSISIQKYADSLQHQIKSIDNKNLNGWILDLRENSGGNCWPMLTGIGPLLGNGICGFFLDNNGNKSPWFYRDGESGYNNTTITKISGQPYKLLNGSNPIAILTGPRTASSGEVVSTAFRNKSNTKSFGLNSAGLSTGNEIFKLSDGAIILLTTSIYVDRNGNVFGDKIKPDEIIDYGYQTIGQPNDPAIKKAIDWINKKQHHTTVRKELKNENTL